MNGRRISGLDLLRILSMFGIIGLHILNQGGLINNLSIYTTKYQIVTIILIVFYTSVNIFAIISGYLNIKKIYNRSNRIIELVFIMLFWCIVITMIFYLFNISNFRDYGLSGIKQGLFPILYGRYWYITCYFLVFFMIPYINKLCTSLKKENFKKLLIILFVLLSVIPCALFNNDLFKILNGYSPFWLIYCYMLGAYMRLFEIKLDRKKTILLIIMFLLLSYNIRIVEKVLESKRIINRIEGDWFINYISPTTVLISLLTLCLFSKINIKNEIIRKILAYLSNASFPVYIIHCHKLIYDYILKDLFLPMITWNSVILFIGIISSILFIYLICCILDELRKRFFKLLRVEKLIEFIGKNPASFMNVLK